MHMVENPCMEPDQHLETLLVEGRRLAAMPADALDAPVPAVEGWTMERVVRHTGKIHQWVAAVIAAGPEADLGAVAASVPGMPHGPDCLPAYAEALEEVHAALSALAPEDPVASFIGPTTARFWQRRQAHEVVVHRIDAADAVHAAGGPAPEPVAADVAADGIDEWARVFLGTRWNQRFGAFPTEVEGNTVHIHGSGVEHAEWLLTFADGSVAVEATHAKGDVALRGDTEALLLALWRRRPLESVDVVGDRAVAERLLDLARF